jgi:hypothetical protein
MREVARVLFGNVDALIRGVDKKRVGTRERDEFLKCDFKNFLVFSFSQNTNTRGKPLLIFLSRSFS